MTDNDSDSDRAVAARAAPRLDPQDDPRSWLPQLVLGWRQAFVDLGDRWRQVGRGGTIVADLLAGLTVAAVALPLNVALARASGMPASAGLVAGAIGGGIAAILGGSQLQVTGPAAALSVMVLAIASKFGPTGVAAATLIVGVVQLLLFAGLAGRVIKLVPESVLTGFTTGVGLKILDQQIPELLGFELLGKDYKFIDLAKMMHEPSWLHHVSWQSVICGLFVAFLVTTTKQFRRFPAAIVGIAVMTFVSTYLGWDVIRVGELPAALPTPALPIVPDEQWLDLLIAALPLALLASVESLLSASAIDRMTKAQKPHNSNLELFGQGIANLAVSTVSGLPVTGVIVRSSVNVQSGGKTKLSALTHAAMLLISVLFLTGVISRVPEAALAGLLLVIGMRLIEVSTLIHLARKEKIEALAFAVTMAGTVTGHLMAGLVAGLAIHAIAHFVNRKGHAARAVAEQHRERGIRAIVGRAAAEARRPHVEAHGASAHPWLPNVRQRAHAKASAYIHPKSSVIGRVVLGDHVHIAATASVRADEGTPFFIGPNSNVQDGVVIHALKNRKVLVAGEEWAVYVGKNVSMAHDALVHGPCYIGDDTFIGFKAVVHDSIIGSRCYIGIGAVVVGVEVPDGRFVPHGAIVDTADAVDRLPPVQHKHLEFNEDVVDVNRGLAAAYHELGSERDARVSANTASESPAPTAWSESWPRLNGKERF
jgi:sulfate permease, SulP family